MTQADVMETIQEAVEKDAPGEKILTFNLARDGDWHAELYKGGALVGTATYDGEVCLNWFADHED